MENLPQELRNNINYHLNDRDVANYELAFNMYDFSDMSDHMYEGAGTFMILTHSEHKIYFSHTNDYSSDGVCYSVASKRPFQAIMHYGIEISRDDILSCFLRYGLRKTPKYSSTSQWSQWQKHQNFVSHISVMGDGRYFTCVHDPTGVSIPLTKKTIDHINLQEWRLISYWDFYGSRLRTGNFRLGDLLNYQETVNGYYNPPPVTYQSRGKGVPEANVSLQDGSIRVVCEGIIHDFDLDDTDFSKFPHEYTASKLQESTDLKLSVLGITGEEASLSPDSIDIDQRKVLELGTNRSEGIKSLINDFEGKIIKYDYVLKPINCNTYYLIVGNNSIVTNLRLEQTTVDDLCSRFKTGVYIMSLISEILGYDVSGSVNSEDVKIGKAILSDMNNCDGISDSPQYPLDILLSMTREPDNSDIEHSQKIIKKCKDQSNVRIPQSRDTLNNYLNHFDASECLTHSKRVTNVPMLYCNKKEKPSNLILDFWNSDLPHHLKKLWSASSSVVAEIQDLEKALSQAKSQYLPEIKHATKKSSIFKPDLSESDKIELAKSGVGAKYFANNETIIGKEKKTKLSFSPYTDTTDVDLFLKKDTLKPNSIRFNEIILQTVLSMKRKSTGNLQQLSIDVWCQLIKSEMIGFFDQVTEIFQELSYNYKHWTVGDQFMCKETISGVKMIIKNTGSHIFVCFAYPKLNIEILDTGRLGPKLYSSDNYIYTDFCSYNEPTLEHFMKSGPYMTSILMHLISRSNSEPTTITDHVNKEFNLISLLFLNNKTDSEELLTSQRYLFMKLFEDATQDPYIFVDRLPEVLRSRLSVFLLQRSITLMDYYHDNRILKVPRVANNTVNYQYLNIKSIVDLTEISIENKINEFYFGYVISKERGRGSDRNFKIIKKILQEEYKFRDTVNNVFVTMTDNVQAYCTDPKLLRVFLHIFRSIMKEKIGDNYEDIILTDYLNKLSFTNFTQLATLKASAREHSKPIDVPANLEDDRKKLLKSLNTRNKEEASKRPKVLEVLIDLTKNYQEETKKPIRHMMQLIPWCLKKLRNKGYFDSDIFPKPQHGGDREIHVLEMMARIVQYSVELISRTLCNYFVSETITHPETKNNFVKRHYQETSSSFKNSFVISKSADASKWCQRHHASHFAAMLVGIAPSILHGFILKSLELWLKKKISFPLQLVATLLANKNTYSTNNTFIRFRDEFYRGTGVFSQCMSNKIEIQSGMMQGILHYTSSLYHTMIQEVCRMMVIHISKKEHSMNVICNIVQGSDDSGMMLGVEGLITKKKISHCYSLLRFKEEISNYLSVNWNQCKSSIGTIDLIEYNSEWHIRHKVIKPTFRWISAAMEVNVRERFIDGYRMFNQLLTDCLEGGASTLELAVIQLNQVWMHCLLLGLNTSILGPIFAENIIQLGDPALGFFPCDYDLCCGVVGVDFQLYCLSINGIYNIKKIDDDTSIQYDYEGSDRSLIPKDLRSVKLKFGKTHIWKSLVDRLNMGTLEWALQEVENDPKILFGRHTSWNTEKPNLILKVFSPGVKESINNVSSTLRMMAAGSYILLRPCMSIFENEILLKLSLFSLVDNALQTKKSYNNPSIIRSCFPLYAEYDEFYKSLTSITQNHTTFSQELIRHTKERVIVFEVNKTKHTLMDLCKRKWNLGGKVSLSSKQFEHEWSRTKLRFNFLDDSIKDTANNLKMNIVELKNFIESLELKARSITLYDTPTRQGGVLNAITRVYWPNVKVRSSLEQLNSEMINLRSDLFSVLTHWISDTTISQNVHDLIQSCKSLRTDFKNVPVKYKRLKTIFDWIHNADKMDLIHQIIDHKQGTLGYFSLPQSIVNNMRIGKGVWIGQVLGIPVKINFNNDYIEKIDIKMLTDSLQLGHALSLLIHEFKSKYNGGSTKSNLWLSSAGKFVSKRNTSGEYIPVWINSDLKVNIIKDIESKPWKLETGGTSIRLKLIESVGSRISYTILSETLSQRDWIETNFSKISDKSVRFWAQSMPFSVSDLEMNIGNSIPSGDKQFYQISRNIYKQYTLNQWNLGKLRERLISIFSPATDIDSEISLMSNIPPESIATLEELNRIMNFVSEGFSEQEFSNMSWADQVELDLIDDNIDASAPSWMNITPDVEDSLKALSRDLEQVYESPDQDQLDVNRWRKMSRSNKFFNNLTQLSHIQTGLSFSDLYEKAKKDSSFKCPGLLGKLISLMLLRPIMEGEDSFLELADLASESSRQVSTIMDETALNELDYTNIMSTINQLVAASDNLTGSAQVEINKSIEKYRRLLEMKLSPTRTSDLEDIDFSKFMTSMVSYLYDNKLTKYWSHNVDDNLKLSLLKVEMIEFRESQFNDNSISNHEYTLFREYLNKNTCTNYLIDSLSECYNINIDIGIYQSICDHNAPCFKF